MNAVAQTVIYVGGMLAAIFAALISNAWLGFEATLVMLLALIFYSLEFVDHGN